MKNDGWRPVKLGQLLKKSEEWVELKPEEIYREVTVKLWGKGVIQRREVTGAEIVATRRNRVHANQFILSRIDARNGAFGIIPDSLEGAIVSNDFPVFTPNPALIFPSFVGWLSKTKRFVDICKSASEGTTNRVRLVEERFLNTLIEIPSISEQKRIVAHIESLATKIEEARELREQTLKESTTFLDVVSNQIFESSEFKLYLTEVGKADLLLNRETRNPAISNPDGEFKYVDISSVKRGPSVLTFGQTVSCVNAPSRARRVIHRDDVIISTVRPNLRAFAKIGDVLDNQICSTGFAVFTCGPSIDQDFLLYQFCSPFFLNQCVDKTTGGHYPAVNDMNLRKIKLVVPPLSEQKPIAKYLAELYSRIEELQLIKAQTAAELDALLPSILDKAFRGEL